MTPWASQEPEKYKPENLEIDFRLKIMYYHPKIIVLKYHYGGHEKDSTPLSAPASAAVHRGRQNPKISLTIIARERPPWLLEAAFAAAVGNP